MARLPPKKRAEDRSRPWRTARSPKRFEDLTEYWHNKGWSPPPPPPAEKRSPRRMVTSERDCETHLEGKAKKKKSPAASPKNTRRRMVTSEEGGLEKERPPCESYKQYREKRAMAPKPCSSSTSPRRTVTSWERSRSSSEGRTYRRPPWKPAGISRSKSTEITQRWSEDEDLSGDDLDSTWPPRSRQKTCYSSPGLVELYDHTTRTCHRYPRPQDSVVPMPPTLPQEPDPQELTGADRGLGERAERRRQVRGCKALRKEQTRREFDEMIRELCLHDRAERIRRITQNKYVTTAHMNNERLKEREQKKEKRMERAFRPFVEQACRDERNQDPVSIVSEKAENDEERVAIPPHKGSAMESLPKARVQLEEMAREDFCGPSRRLRESPPVKRISSPERLIKESEKTLKELVERLRKEKEELLQASRLSEEEKNKFRRREEEEVKEDETKKEEVAEEESIEIPEWLMHEETPKKKKRKIKKKSPPPSLDNSSESKESFEGIEILVRVNKKSSPSKKEIEDKEISSGTSYASPPDVLNPSQVDLLGSVLNRISQRNKNPRLEQYIVRLLAMSRESVEALSITSSEKEADEPEEATEKKEVSCQVVAGTSPSLDEDVLKYTRLTEQLSTRIKSLAESMASVTLAPPPPPRNESSSYLDLPEEISHPVFPTQPPHLGWPESTIQGSVDCPRTSGPLPKKQEETKQTNLVREALCPPQLSLDEVRRLGLSLNLFPRPQDTFCEKQPSMPILPLLQNRLPQQQVGCDLSTIQEERSELICPDESGKKLEHKEKEPNLVMNDSSLSLLSGMSEFSVLDQQEMEVAMIDSDLSSSSGIEEVFNSLGIGWAIPTLHKIRESRAKLSSSESEKTRTKTTSKTSSSQLRHSTPVKRRKEDRSKPMCSSESSDSLTLTPPSLSLATPNLQPPSD